MRFPWRLVRAITPRRAAETGDALHTSYETATVVESRVVSGVKFTIAKVSFGRRVELMRRVRELARRLEFLEAGQEPGEKMDAAILRAEIDRLYVAWGVQAVSGLALDGTIATPESLMETGSEELFQEALAAVRAETGLTGEQRKNF
jgi:hypothetical protein